VDVSRLSPGEQLSVQVDTLEFDGIDVKEPARVQWAFQGELTRLLTERGLPERVAPSPGGVSLEGGSLTAPDLSSPERLGAAVAQLVYAELSR
jgi:hypothetical protein